MEPQLDVRGTAAVSAQSVKTAERPELRAAHVGTLRVKQDVDPPD